MRVVMLCSSVYSETACAIAVRLSQSGYVPAGALVLSTLQRTTLQRKLSQWGAQNVLRYARSKLPWRNGYLQRAAHNPYLQPMLKGDDGIFRSLRQVAASHGFPLRTCKDQNAPDSIECLRQWSPDLIVFTGGDILRKPLLDVPRFGILNAHLGLLPEVRGMSAPEWSLLSGVPIGVTIHYIDAGIDTGPILQRYEYPDASRCRSLSDLRNHLIALGVEKMVEVVAALDRGTISATPQPDRDQDRQFFAMHEWLQSRAASVLSKSYARAANG